MSITTSNPFALLDMSPTVAPRKPRAAKTKSKSKNSPQLSGHAAEESFAAAGNVAPDSTRSAARGAAHPHRAKGAGARPHHNGRTNDRHSMTAHVDTRKTVAQGWGGSDAQRELMNERLAGEDALSQYGHDSEHAADAHGPSPAGTTAAAGKDQALLRESRTLTLEEYLASMAAKSKAAGYHLPHTVHPVRSVSPPPAGARALSPGGNDEDQAYYVPRRASAQNGSGGGTHGHNGKAGRRGSAAHSKKASATIDTSFSFPPPVRPSSSSA